ncbi:hypothetical protein Scep_013391 [Stephania cephalantha]|uniref:QWRF motif-containing protein 3 n=1 Tax=Stephania cephalantha TaxID=152367 RepID=A0AAP0JIR2_9MAGN
MKNEVVSDERVSFNSDHSFKSRRAKSREVSSRFLSPTPSSSSSLDQTGSSLSSPNRAPKSSVGVMNASSSSRKQHQSAEDMSLIRGLWPSSSSSSSSSKKLGTLAEHLGNDRLKDFIERKNGIGIDGDRGIGSGLISRRRSSSSSKYLSRFGKEKDQSGSKENHRPVGGSARYTGKSLASRRTSTDSLSDLLSSGSECSDGVFSSTDTISTTATSSILSSKLSSQKPSIEVSSRYMKPRRGTSSDSNITATTMNTTSTTAGAISSLENSNNFSSKNNLIGRSSSMRVYGSVISQWAMSPGRSGSPPLSVENGGKPVVSFSSMRPPNSPSKGVGNLLNFGLELFKAKRSTSPSTKHGSVGEDAHLLRLLYNRFLQWRYVNARALALDASKKSQAQGTLLNAWANLSTLKSSVVLKHIHFNKQKLELKLNSILCSQIQNLEAWGDMERQHTSAVSTTKDSLNSIVCRVPLKDGAKVDTQRASVALRNATDLSASMKTMLIDFSPTAQKTSTLLSELAEVVAREKSLLVECLEMIELVSALEMQERSLKCNIIQLKLQRNNSTSNNKNLYSKSTHFYNTFTVK